MIQHNFSYEGALADAQKVTWRVEDLIGGDKRLDFTKAFLPDSLAGSSSLSFLSDNEKLIHNQIRGYTYLYLFGFVEEFILPYVLDHARSAVHGDMNEVRALATFAEEEAKHMQLFQRFVQEFKAGFATSCGVIGPAKDVAGVVLSHGKLGVGILILHLEWMTQRHYLESVKDTGDLDPQFASMLRHHWMEESQHAKLDTIIVDQLASAAGPEGIDKGISDFLAIGGAFDGLLGTQAKLDLDSLQTAIGRTLSDAEKEQYIASQHRSYRWTFLVSGMKHPNFVRALNDMTPAGAVKVAEVAIALS